MLVADILMVASAAFSLICEGTRTTKFGQLEPRIETVSVEYRIDLGAKRFCMEPCEQSTPIHKVADDVVTLANSDQREEGNTSSAVLTVHRSNGHWLERIDVTSPHVLEVVTAGRCAHGPAKPVPMPPRP